MGHAFGDAGIHLILYNAGLLYVHAGHTTWINYASLTRISTGLMLMLHNVGNVEGLHGANLARLVKSLHDASLTGLVLSDQNVGLLGLVLSIGEMGLGLINASLAELEESISFGFHMGLMPFGNNVDRTYFARDSKRVKGDSCLGVEAQACNNPHLSD